MKAQLIALSAAAALALAVVADVQPLPAAEHEMPGMTKPPEGQGMAPGSHNMPGMSGSMPGAGGAMPGMQGMMPGMQCMMPGMMSGMMRGMMPGMGAASGMGSMGGVSQPSGDDGPASLAFQGANNKMHSAMTMAYSGDVEVDFAKSMIPHHQGAIDMAKIELAFGSDPEIRKLAEGIIKAQEAEIALMKAWLAKKGQ